MGTIQERKKKDGVHYTANVRLRGYPVKTETFEKKSEAKEWIQSTEHKFKNGIELPQVVTRKEKTLGEVIDRYIDEELQHRNSDHLKFKTHLAWWKKHLG